MAHHVQIKTVRKAWRKKHGKRPSHCKKSVVERRRLRLLKLKEVE